MPASALWKVGSVVLPYLNGSVAVGHECFESDARLRGASLKNGVAERNRYLDVTLSKVKKNSSWSRSLVIA